MEITRSFADSFFLQGLTTRIGKHWYEKRSEWEVRAKNYRQNLVGPREKKLKNFKQKFVFPDFSHCSSRLQKLGKTWNLFSIRFCFWKFLWRKNILLYRVDSYNYSILLTKRNIYVDSFLLPWQSHDFYIYLYSSI